ncbi:hypothetical protein GE061_007018 [Apolygus lucorum]|uniref:Amino acid transporter transmembrane domain-containing protein n=1 Tax=Apolygus lucorum TaxID=248454 RepID=A0A6A4IVX9_APOLU|nr:hypothetical protein GE061_007018 [Apolygus lucorum]
MPSVISINNGDFNMSSTLKLADNDVIQKNARNSALSKSDLDLYDPFEHRDKSHTTSTRGALTHLLKSSLGSGILAMPHAFLHGGLLFGAIGTIIVGFICTHCVQILVDCSQKLSARVKRPALGFEETAEIAFNSGPEQYRGFAKFARAFVKCSLFATYYFGNTVYVVFVATSFQQVLENQFNFHIDIRFWILLVTIPLVPLGSIRTMRALVPLSITALVLIMFGLSITLYYTFTDIPPLSQREMITHPKEWPLFFATVLFAMEGIGTVLPIENSMEHPQHFLGCPGVLNTAMSVVVILYGFVGFFGYARFGPATQASVTLNLGSETSLGDVVKILVALSILFTYGLQFTVPTEIVWKKIGPMVSESKQEIGYYVMRIAMILGTVIIAVIVPDLGPFISLVGAVCFSILGLFCPAIIELMTYYDEGYGPMKYLLIKDIIVIILAAAALISGTYSSIDEIIAFYMK